MQKDKKEKKKVRHLCSFLYHGSVICEKKEQRKQQHLQKRRRQQ